MSESVGNSLYEFTEEQKALLEKYVFNASLYTTDSNAGNFVIPYIRTADGSPAQIRATSKGLYKDIQRSPFIRKSGVFDENGSIPDIDISPLVYYGTLEQAKIAPTLENVDIRLYYREPKLKRVPDERNSVDPNSYADNYIWREIPIGFHVYNNDTVYGYEWLVLQDDYVSGTKKDYLQDTSDGVYNLHMNIEDGLGVCKFAGTQAPISLKGVQYKIIITAKNLWNREYSLLESMPLATSLAGNTDSLAPSVNAVRNYYEKSLHTKEVISDNLIIGPYSGSGWEKIENPLLQNTEDGIFIKKLTIGQVLDAEVMLNTLDSTLTGHIESAIAGGLTDEAGNAIGVHGIVNLGAKGNLDAKTLAGASLSNGAQSVSENVPSLAYIPFVDELDRIGLGTVITHYKRSSGKNPVPYYQVVLSANDAQKTMFLEKTSMRDEISEVLETLNVGSTKINLRYAKVASVPTVSLTSGRNEDESVNFKVAKLTTEQIDFGGGYTINANKVQQWNGSSSIAKKNMHSELLGIKIKDADKNKYADLEPNIAVDADGNKVDTVHTLKLEDSSLTVPDCDIKDAVAWTKLGSALQALYELPLGTYQYKRGGAEYKEQLGLFVERVNQVRDHLLDLAGATIETDNNGLPAKDNYVVHKRNTYIKSKHDHVRDGNEGFGSLTDNTDPYKIRVENNAYSYTKEEIKSIKNYMNLLTSKDELAQELRNTVGVLLVAAKETQERLLDVETAVYGWDAKTVPGDDAGKKKFIENQIAPSLQTQLVNSPLLLGLNRLMRALLLEVYDTTDLEQIDAEIESRVTDSDGIGEKATVKSRMDQIDEIMNVIYSQQSAMIKFYVENILNDESSHTYTDIVDKDGKQRITPAQLKELVDFWDKEHLSDDHTEQKDRDTGRAWKNLPAKDDVTTTAKQKVGFAQVAESAHKHTPNLDETGLVRVPIMATDTDNVSEGDTEHLDKSVYSGETNRQWDLFKLDKYKKEVTDDYASAGTYLPFYRTKAVAWDSAKLERINTKLSEVTKTVYGTDDVTASLPNRTEVLRRNITNLVDDLYPNRSFKIENPISIANDPTAEFYLPFKTSNVQSVQNKVTSANNDEPEQRQHTSILRWFDNEIFNFKIVNHFIGTTLKSSTGADDYAKNKQVSLSERAQNILTFDTAKLVSDETPFDSNNYGTYQKAYSRIDMLENLLGVKDCYITDLYGDSLGILKAGNKDLISSLDKLALGYSSAQQVVAQQSVVDNIKAELDNLTYQKSDLESQIATKTKEIESLQKQLSSSQAQLNALKNETFDQATADVKVASAKSNVQSLTTSISNKESEIRALETTCTNIQNSITAVNENIAQIEAEIINIKTKIEAETVATTTLDNLESLAEAMHDIYLAYKPLEESKTFKLKDWIVAHTGTTDNDAEDYSKLSAFTKNSTVFEAYGSACNGDDDALADDTFTLKIEKSYTKHTTVFEEKPSHGGTAAITSTQTYTVTKEYYTRSDTPEALYYDFDLKNPIKDFTILSIGDVTETELEAAVTEEVEHKTTDAEGKEVVTKETVVKKDAVTRQHHTDAIVWVKSEKKDLYGELVTISKLAYNINTGKYYELVDDSPTRCSLKEITDLYATDLSKATIFTSTKDVVLDSAVIAKSLYKEYVLINNASVVYRLVSLPDHYTLDYSFTYSLDYDGPGTLPVVNAANNLDLNADYSYPRVYNWKGTATVSNLNDPNQTLTFDKTEESFICNGNLLWTDANGNSYNTAVARTTSDLEHANEEAEDILVVKTEDDLKNTDESVKELQVQEQNLEAAKADLKTKTDNLNTQTSNLATANSELTKLQADLVSAQEALDQAEIVATNLGDSQEANKEKQENLNAVIASYNSQIATCTTTKTNLEKSLSTVNSSIATKNTELSTEQAKLNSLGNSAVDVAALPFYAAELRYTNFTKQQNQQNSLDYIWELSDDIQKSSNVGYVLSRKSKTIQERLTTAEAFLDILAKGFNYEVDMRDEKVDQEAKASSVPTKLGKNAPFEGVNPWKSLKRVFDTVEGKQVDHRIYDLDLSESWHEGSVDFTEHNRKVWQVMKFSRYAEKGPFTLSSESHIIGSYDITNIQLAVDPSILPYQDPDYLAGWTKFNDATAKTIHVVYLAKGQVVVNLTKAAKNTIYLAGKTPVSAYKNFYKSTNTNEASTFLDTSSSKGWQNQTEYNIYKTVSNLFTSLMNNGKDTIQGTQVDDNLYYSFMKLVYPVGSVYLDTVIVGKTLRNPANLFGGKWLQVAADAALETATTPSTISQTSGTIATVAAIKMSQNQLAPHSHDIGSHKHGMQHEHLFNSDNNVSGNGYTRHSNSGSSSAKGSGGGSNWWTKGCNKNETDAASGTTGSWPASVANQTALTAANIPNFKVAVWVRIA